MKSIKLLLKTTRPSFLVLVPICVLLGLSISIAAQTPINNYLLFLILLGALFAHTSVNLLNEYLDFKSGLDFNTKKTDFSGGSGTLPNNPELANLTGFLGLVSLLLTIVIGLFFISMKGFHLLPIGLLGVMLVATYTQWLNRSPVLCLLAPGLGFGVLMVVGTQLVLDDHISGLAWEISIIPFLLFNNLLLLNQYPDIDADKEVGRKTFPIVFGTKASTLVYALFMIIAYALVLIYIIKGDIPHLAVLALAPIILSVYSLTGAIKHDANIGQFPQYLATNVAAALLTPLLLALAIIFG